MPRIETAGVKRHFTFNYHGDEYRVFDTTPRRNQDVFRFELWKTGDESEPRIVSFQDEQGDSGQCSCKGWIFGRKKGGECRHIKLCRAEFLTGSTPTPRQPSQAARKAAQPAPVQLTLLGTDQVAEMRAKVATLREQYRTKKDEFEALVAKADAIKQEMELIERDGRLLKDKIEARLPRKEEGSRLMLVGKKRTV